MFRFRLALAICLSTLMGGGVPTSALAQVSVSKGQSTGESAADLRFVRGEDAPVIARESFHFRPDGWIIGRVREGNTEFWGLTPPQTIDNIEIMEPEVAERLADMSKQILEGGAYRSQTEAILASAGFSGEELDKAVTNGNVAWNTGMGWANVLQVHLADTHVLYVALYATHEFPNPAENVPVDAAIVLLPGKVATRTPIQVARPVSQWPYVVSTEAQKYFDQGDYARCVQAGLGVSADGQIGPGTNRAWSAWLEERKLPVPKVTNKNAGRYCGAFLGKAKPGFELKFLQDVFFPLTDMGFPGILEGIQADPQFVPTVSINMPGTVMAFEYSSEKVNQVSLVNIGEMPNWPVGGIYMLTGKYEFDEDWKLLEELTKRDHALAMFNLGNAVLRSKTKEQGGELVITHDMLRFATDDLPSPNGEEDDVLWSDLGYLDDGRRLLAADIGFPEVNNLRFVVFYADGKPIAGSLMPGPHP